MDQLDWVSGPCAGIKREAVYVSIFSRAEKPATLMALAMPLIASSLLLGGCMGSPTYGTDKTAGAQLLDDVTSITKFSPERKQRIDYKPRPELVKPASSKDLALPPPQEQLASASNPDWVESPEQRRKRIREKADEANDTGAFRDTKGAIASDEIEPDVATTSMYDDDDKVGRSQRYRPGTEQAVNNTRRAEIQRRIRENQQGSPTKRRYLSEPPLDYRQAAATAPADDIGEDEVKKERRAKAAAKKPGSSRWSDYIPGF